MIQDICDSVDRTRDDVRRMVNHITTNLTGQVPGAENPDIPEQLDPRQHKHLHWWKQETWQQIRNNSNLKPSDTTSPILSLYFEDEEGNEISNGIKEEVRGDLFAYWLDMARKGELPASFKNLGLKRREHFCETIVTNSTYAYQDTFTLS
jgi:hypothetical protein